MKVLKPWLFLFTTTIRLPREVSSFLSPSSTVLLYPTNKSLSSVLKMSSTSATTSSWSDLQSVSSKTVVGAALNKEQESRLAGTGAPFVQNKLRLFGSEDTTPKLTLYRDHAGMFYLCIKCFVILICVCV